MNSKSQYQIEYDNMVEFAVQVLESRPSAARWLTSPNKALENKTPNEVCLETNGIERVIDLLWRIEYGVYS